MIIWEHLNLRYIPAVSILKPSIPLSNQGAPQTCRWHSAFLVFPVQVWLGFGEKVQILFSVVSSHSQALPEKVGAPIVRRFLFSFVINGFFQYTSPAWDYQRRTDSLNQSCSVEVWLITQIQNQLHSTIMSTFDQRVHISKVPYFGTPHSRNIVPHIVLGESYMLKAAIGSERLDVVQFGNDSRMSPTPSPLELLVGCGPDLVNCCVFPPLMPTVIWIQLKRKGGIFIA